MLHNSDGGPPPKLSLGIPTYMVPYWYHIRFTVLPNITVHSYYLEMAITLPILYGFASNLVSTQITSRSYSLAIYLCTIGELGMQTLASYISYI